MSGNPRRAFENCKQRPHAMRRQARSVALLALLLALCVGAARAGVTASYEVVDAQMSFLPSSPPQFITAGIVTIKADEPIYVKAGNCQSNNFCDLKNIVPCCPVRMPLFIPGAGLRLTGSLSFLRHSA